MVTAIVQFIAILLVPYIITKTRNNPVTSLFGTIGLAYAVGFVVAVIIYFVNRAGVAFALNSDIGEIGSYAAIGIAIPMLMFECDFTEMRRLSRTVLMSFASLIVSVLVVAIVAYYIYGGTFESGRDVAVMSIGLYTGGTPNFNAIGAALGVDLDTIALANLSDMILGGIVYMFLLFAAKPLFGKILKKAPQGAYMKTEGDVINVDEVRKGVINAGIVRNCVLALIILAVSGGIGVVIWMLGDGSSKLTDALVPAMMIGGTVLGLAFSFNKNVRQVKENSAVGHYLILVFSFALASSLNLGNVSPDFYKIFILLAIVTVGSMIIHVIISRILGTDVDCAITTMTAGIYGPAFVPAITSQLDNDKMTAPGLICGAVGYAVGTLLGIMVGVII